jgi:hypothetical protein
MRYPSGHPYESNSVDLAFVIRMKDLPLAHQKWSQPPIEIDPTAQVPVYYGWDEESRYHGEEPIWYPGWECPTQCHGDADCDGDVDANDYNDVVIPSWLRQHPDPDYDARADFDRDLDVDYSDLDIMTTWWHLEVPEPPNDCPDEPHQESSWKVVADDFKCLGPMPITAVRWWGSHIGWTSMEPPIDEAPRAWRIGFWSSTPDPNPQNPATFSAPGQLLWQIQADSNRVAINTVGDDNSPDLSKPSDTCFQYYVRLEPNEVFWQEEHKDSTTEDVFWLSIAAVYHPNDGYVEFPWGWKTRPQHWRYDAVTFDVIGQLSLGTSPTNLTPLEHAGDSFDVAFELDTDPNWMKWEQPFVDNWRGLDYWDIGFRGWQHYHDEKSMATEIMMEEPNIERLVADDWQAEDELPVVAICWWGSYIDYRYNPDSPEPMTPPVAPKYFQLSMWDDVPEGSQGNEYSHPNDTLWTYDANASDYVEVMVGYDKEPNGESGPPREPVYRYSVGIPEGERFNVPNARGIYWLSVVAVYDQITSANYDWGWTNRKHMFNDDAVSGHLDGQGQWEWTELYDQTGASQDMSFVLFTEPCQPEDLDFGDAPEPNYPTLLDSNGARHVIGGPYFCDAGGDDAPDAEADGQPTPLADGDDSDGDDDEDGVIFPVLVQGQQGNVSLNVYGGGGMVEIWIDYNGDEDWDDANEFVFNGYVGNGPNTIVVTVPADSAADDGEVEDHAVTIARQQDEFDFGDAPDPNYPTLLANNGARHIIGGPFFCDIAQGDAPDPEGNGQPTPLADGDDLLDLNDDEDGVSFPVLVQGQPNNVTLHVCGAGPGRAWVQIWIDWDGSESWEAGEEVYNAWLTNGTYNVPVTPPGNSVVGMTFARCRISTAGTLLPTGQADDGEVEDHPVTIQPGEEELDFGDAPDPNYPTLLANNGARHVIGGPYFCDVVGSDAPDPEPNGQPTPLANGDDLLDLNDDEDGVSIPVLVQNQPNNVTLRVCGASPGRAWVRIWIDWDGSGSWEAGEEVYNAWLTDGTYNVPVTPPGNSVVGMTFARCRISTAGTLLPTGQADDGEVEDHPVTIQPGEEDLDFGDAPDPNYPTLLANNGARHVIDGPFFCDATGGDAPDAEPNGQPTPSANGDDSDGNDDEDGVSFPVMVQGQPNEITVSVCDAEAGGAWVQIWIDWDGSGSWEAAEEVNDLLTNGDHNVPVTPPADSIVGPTFARCRISSAGGLSPTGQADDGEVEDHVVVIREGIEPTCWDSITQCRGQSFGDSTCDGWINLADLFALKMYFGSAAPWTPPECCSDYNHDGQVNLGDLFILKMGFGSGPYAPATGNQNCP